MNIQKRKLCNLDRCYAAATTTIDGKLKYLFAAENDNPCYAFDAESGVRETIWEHPGGTMSMIPIPCTNGEFLAVQGFKEGFMAQDTTLVWAKPSANGWEIKTILKHPFIHRFDILAVGNIKYLLICTLATSKKNSEDWSDPGKLWAAKLPDNLDEPITLEIIYENMTKNHGYCHINWEGKAGGLVTCQEGVFTVFPPEAEGKGWSVEKLIDRPVSDIAAVDIDQDGVLELATIEPFHGNTFVINKKTDSGYKIVYQYKGDYDFGHVAWGGMLRGIPTFIGGARSGAQELFYIQWNKHSMEFETSIIEAGIGPSNIFVVNTPHKDIILAANREIAEAALYIVTD